MDTHTFKEFVRSLAVLSASEKESLLKVADELSPPQLQAAYDKLVALVQPIERNEQHQMDVFRRGELMLDQIMSELPS